jgi:1,4-alpha-glucan branching enzyme
MKNDDWRVWNNMETLKSDLAAYLYCQGTNTYSYDYLGVHVTRETDGYRCIFRVWAPNAYNVFVCGDFNGWDDSLPMYKDSDSGIWFAEYFSKTNPEGVRYKYKIVGANGTHLKADPYAFYSETLKNTASRIYDISKFEWHDEQWRESAGRRFCRAEGHFCSSPVNIYEVHLGSWKTRGGKNNVDGDAYLNYREIADELAPYLVDMGYTHVELMPIMEHPFDGSWGYQVCGYYSPTARYGTPSDFAYFVDKMHRGGIGVILDWVPAHFPKDEHGLYEFDGGLLYEYKGKDRMEHKGWGTRCFDVGYPAVQSFLISNALFWMRNYHVDGLRVDAVAAMLYLDFDKDPGEWVPNKYGDNKNLESVAFFQKLNKAVFAEFPYAFMIAEESADWDQITKPVHEGGLGFNFKWNMGWANDVYEYVEVDPFFRKGSHQKLTFPMMYAFTENYILPISHDEVVHGKKSLLDKMYGSYEEKFPAMRAFLAYMMTFPGKKMMFMGTEYAPFREWDYENQLEWFMLDYDNHAKMKQYVKELNLLYKRSPELWEIDDSWQGFEWIEADQAELNVISYRRIDSHGNDLVVVINFSPEKRENYKVKVSKRGIYEEIFNSDNARYGGENVRNGVFKAKNVHFDNEFAAELNITLPSYGALVFKRRHDGVIDGVRIRRK